MLAATAGFVFGLRAAAHRRVVITFGAVAMFAYLLALAPAWEPSFAVYRRIPFLSFFQVPGRVLIVAALWVAALAALVTSSWRTRRVTYVNRE